MNVTLTYAKDGSLVVQIASARHLTTKRVVLMEEQAGHADAVGAAVLSLISLWKQAAPATQKTASVVGPKTEAALLKALKKASMDEDEMGGHGSVPCSHCGHIVCIDPEDY